MAKGFDISIYPGDTAMANWWNNTPFSFCGFYLAPTASGQHTNTSWMSKRSYLQGLGYGLAIVYVGRQASQSSLTYAQGQADAADANTLAHNAGFTKVNTTIYLDIEQGGTISSSFLSYVNGWIDYIAAMTIYKPGIYCSHASTADQIRNANSNGVNNCDFWVWNLTQPPSPGNSTSTGTLTPADSGVSYAVNWQYAQNVSETWNGSTLTVDLDLSSRANPSNA